MTIVDLYEKHGHLYFHSREEWMGSNEQMVLYRYPEGDADTFHWPLDLAYRTKDEQLGQIARAMSDARECGEIPSDTGMVVLPDGTKVDLL